ncbi:MAG: hypothetical protein IJA80_04740 [Clostridia bacterium]|nr:hypothetical protein [Clostridia bacterium]
MKMMKNVFMTLMVLLLLSCNCLTTYAINSGFDLEPVSNERELQIQNNINICVFEQEVSGNTIECFDVNDDGMIALGTNKSSQKFISIYNSQGVFQYGYQFDCSGSFGIEWDANDIIIYFVRSDIACSVNPVGEIQEILDIKNTSNNNSYWNNNVFSTTRTVGNVKYRIQNDFGILNIFSTSYSQLVIQDSNGQMKTIYDVNSQQLFKLVFEVVCILLFIPILLFSLRKHGVRQGTVL